MRYSIRQGAHRLLVAVSLLCFSESVINVLCDSTGKELHVSDCRVFKKDSVQLFSIPFPALLRECGLNAFLYFREGDDPTFFVLHEPGDKITVLTFYQAGALILFKRGQCLNDRLIGFL